MAGRRGFRDVGVFLYVERGLIDRVHRLDIGLVDIFALHIADGAAHADHEPAQADKQDVHLLARGGHALGGLVRVLLHPDHLAEIPADHAGVEGGRILVKVFLGRLLVDLAAHDSRLVFLGFALLFFHLGKLFVGEFNIFFLSFLRQGKADRAHQQAQAQDQT